MKSFLLVLTTIIMVGGLSGCGTGAQGEQIEGKRGIGKFCDGTNMVYTYFQDSVSVVKDDPRCIGKTK